MYPPIRPDETLNEYKERLMAFILNREFNTMTEQSEVNDHVHAQAEELAGKHKPDPNRVGGPVNHPPHYNQHPAGIECIDVIEHMTHNIGAAIKYVWRAGLKPLDGDASSRGLYEGEIQDLRKAIWYIEREIRRVSKVPYQAGWRDPRKEARDGDGAQRPR